MFERFTDRARQVVVLAQEEARMLGQNFIGTEHLLLGLVHEGEGVAARVLVGMGLDLDRLRHAVEAKMEPGGGTGGGHIPFTPRAKTALELSLREALTLGHNYIGTEHILLGLVREGTGVASQILTDFGATASAIRDGVLVLMTGAPVVPPEPADRGVQATQAGHGVQATQAGHGVQATQAGHGVQATQAGTGPTCPSCKSHLDDRIGWKDLTATGDEGSDVQPVRVLYCRTCRSVLGVVARSGE